MIEKWNKISAQWLRFLVYSRHATPYNLYFTYAVSSLWHGFYPGYYVFFATLVLITIAARKWRRVMRPRLLGHFDAGLSEEDRRWRQDVYDIYTWLAVKCIAAYFTVPFVLLSLDEICRCYGEMFWFGHVLAVIVILALPQDNNNFEAEAKMKAKAGAQARLAAKNEGRFGPIHASLKTD